MLHLGYVKDIFVYELIWHWLMHFAGWMATVWVYPAEILPLKIRSKGAALAAAADFLGNFLVSLYYQEVNVQLSSD